MKKITFFLVITFAFIFNSLKADADLENVVLIENNFTFESNL